MRNQIEYKTFQLLTLLLALGTLISQEKQSFWKPSSPYIFQLQITLASLALTHSHIPAHGLPTSATSPSRCHQSDITFLRSCRYWPRKSVTPALQNRTPAPTLPQTDALCQGVEWDKRDLWLTHIRSQRLTCLHLQWLEQRKGFPYLLLGSGPVTA